MGGARQAQNDAGRAKPPRLTLCCLCCHCHLQVELNRKRSNYSAWVKQFQYRPRADAPPASARWGTTCNSSWTRAASLPTQSILIGHSTGVALIQWYLTEGADNLRDGQPDAGSTCTACSSLRRFRRVLSSRQSARRPLHGGPCRVNPPPASCRGSPCLRE